MVEKILRALKEVWHALAGRSVLIPIIGAATVLCIALSNAAINTYVVYDGDNVTAYNSFAANSAQVLEEIGVELEETDIVDMPEKPVNGLAEIRINRGFDVTVTADGETKTLRVSKNELVSDILTRAGISLGTQDIVSQPAHLTAQAGDNIVVTRYMSYKVEELVNIPFVKETQKTDRLDRGTTKVLQEGSNGQKKQVYQVILRDGQQTRTLISEETIKAPTNKIVQVGTRAIASNPGTVAVNRGETPLRYKQVLNVTATAYTTERQRHKRTATGAVARVGLIAVDPRVIPLGSRLYITSADGKSWVYGTAVAADTGGAIKGNRIDLFFDTHRECINFGRRKAKVYVLE